MIGQVLRRTRRGYEEIAPRYCWSCGGRFGPGRTLVGTAHCACGIMHRSHWCANCGATTYTPPLGKHCRARNLDTR
ncbi:hypothetical protein I552_0647 [Mycobacterium xenopi 3993]|nr:hypothetical protein I552_0647 [Mycobacterium xenopi 3993]